VPGTGITYPSIRTFYRPHPQGAKLPSKPTPIPLLVFVHGLGGSVAQWNPLLTSLVNIAPCLAIDLPGCGLSKFAPKSWEAYTPDSLAQLLAVCIKKHCEVENGQGVVLVCHSMGCSLAALLASSTSPHSHLLSEHVLGMVGICPSAEPPAMKQAAAFRKLLNIPGPIFDLWRRWDRRGGTESASVARFVGPGAEEETKKLQVRFNEQSRTPTWRRMAYGLLPDYSTGEPRGGMAGEKIWAGVQKPLFLVAGESDSTTPPENVQKIAKFLGQAEEFGKLEDSAQDVGNCYESISSSPSEQRTGSSIVEASKQTVLKIKILPSPASHALLYAPRTARPLSAHIQKFLTSHIDRRLSFGWQLQYLTTEGKWDVKNFEKWQAVEPVSPPFASIFRAMKTLREVDESHSPKVFVEEWAAGSKPSQSDGPIKAGKDGLGAIVAVVDISHETPVYDPRGLENGGIVYRKFPTVSKLPPSVDEVKQFIDLIDELRRELLPSNDPDSKIPPPVIAIHCHYGFNRTGFIVIAYMVERLGWPLKDAIAEFAKKRPRGVRHSHFVDELWARYWTKGQEARPG
jgi:pimeloyl-ACP methyl ester carboxylesterase/protein-tyrosine phosphatase